MAASRRQGPISALILVAVLLALCGCADSAARLPPIPDATQTAYVLGPGDRLKIAVFGRDEASGLFTIGGAGNLATPLIGEIKAGGLTVEQLQKAYTRALEQGFYKDPKVAVEVETYRPFYIMGEVRKPGSFPYASGLTVTAAIAEAGGFTPHADRDLAVIERKTPTGVARGRATGATAVMPDDIIEVPEAIF